MPQRFKVHEPLRPHFITSTVLHWIPVFCRDDYFHVLVDSLNHCVHNRALAVHAYVLMPNHFHLICSHPEGDLSGVVRDVKRYTSRQLTRMLERDTRDVWLRAMQRAAGTGQAKLWEDTFHPEQIHSAPFLQQKSDYIHNNPVKAGYVCAPSDWKYSSAGLYFEDRESLIRITPIEL